MNIIPSNIKYIKWQSADDIHMTSKEWLSELQFIQDEHLFFSDLITTYTSQLMSHEEFSKTRNLVDNITASQKRNNLLIEAIKTHENDLKILVDGINQIKEEKAYIKEHKGLLTEITAYLNDYKQLKTRLFNVFKSLKKDEKRFIDKP